MTIALFIVFVVFYVAGYLLNKYPPKRINSLYGYRTRKSMASQERWDYAQKYSGRIAKSHALIMLGAALLSLLFNFSETVDTVLTFLVFL